MIGSNGVMQDEVSEEFAFPDLLEILRRCQRVILTTLFFSVVAGIFLSTRSLQYIWEGGICVQPSTASMYKRSPFALLSGDSSYKIVPKVTTLQSRTPYLQIVLALIITNDPAFWYKRSLKFQSLDAPKVKEQTFRLMREIVNEVN